MFNFFSAKFFAIDLSDSSLELAEIKGSLGNPILSCYSRIELLNGLMKKGNIVNAGELTKIIREQLKKADIRTKNALVIVPESRSFSYIFKLPKIIEDREIPQAIAQEAKKVIPLDLDECYHDFFISRVDQKSKYVYFSACEKKYLDKIKELCVSTGINPQIFENEGMAIIRSITDKFSVNEDLLVVDIGADTTNIFVIQGGSLAYTQTINIGGNDFTKMVAQKLNIDIKDAEEKKKEAGFDEKYQNGEIVMILQSSFQEIFASINKTINFFKEQADFNPGKVLLTGGSANLKQIEDYFSSNLQLKTQQAGVKINIDKYKNLDINLALPVIGGAFRVFKPDEGINFIK